MDDDAGRRPPGARDVAAVLSTDPGYRLLGRSLERPIVLGLAIVAIVVLAIVFGAASESRFIYTDF